MSVKSFRELWYETKDMRPSFPGSYEVRNGVLVLISPAPSSLSYQQLRANATLSKPKYGATPKNTTTTPSIDALINTLENIVAGKDMASKLEDSAWEEKRRERYQNYLSAFK